MAGVAGLEPVTSAVTGQRSNQLSYTPAKGKVTLKKFSAGVKVFASSKNVWSARKTGAITLPAAALWASANALARALARLRSAAGSHFRFAQRR